MRGQISEHETKDNISLKRNLLNSCYSLSLNKESCNGCGVCSEVCPKEAITYIPSLVENGVLVKKPTIGFDTDSCIFCGECAVLCPLNALTMKIDGKEISTVERNQVFPSLLKGVRVFKEKVSEYDSDFLLNSMKKVDSLELSRCSPECEGRCEKECPTGAIKVVFQRSDNNQIEKIVDVAIDESRCFYCQRCELACPFDAIKVEKPFYGQLDLKSDLCPKDCVACQDICPSKAIRREAGRLVVSRQFCVFCSACEKVCPKQAITVHRDKIFHTDICAAAWLTAFKKLTSLETFRKEAMITATKRRISVVERRKKHLGFDLSV